MLPVKNRLHPRDISSVKLGGNKCFSSFFKLTVLPDAKLPNSLLQIKIYKKTVALASSRNCQKRILRGLIQKIIPQIKKPVKIILQLNKSVDKINNKDLYQELYNLCHRANIV